LGWIDINKVDKTSNEISEAYDNSIH